MGRRKKGSRQAPPSEEFFAMMEALAKNLGIEVRRNKDITLASYNLGNVVRVNTDDTDFTLAHEMGHAIDFRLTDGQRQLMANKEDRVERDSEIPKEEKQFARRQQAEGVRVARESLPPMTLSNFMQSEKLNSPLWLNKLIYFPKDSETRASLFASYLTEPDSVPDFAMFADSVLNAHGLSEIAGKVQESFLSQLHRKNKEK